MLFPDRLAGLLCRDAALVEAGFGLYLRVLVLSAPVLVAVLTMVSFLPSGGSPNLAMVLNLVANGVNIAMDWVYIRWFGMGVEGAAWATLTGYLAGALLLPFAFGKKSRLRVRPAGLADLRLLGRAPVEPHGDRGHRFAHGLRKGRAHLAHDPFRPVRPGLPRGRSRHSGKLRGSWCGRRSVRVPLPRRRILSYFLGNCNPRSHNGDSPKLTPFCQSKRDPFY